MLFDLSDCVQPYTPLCTPTTCAAQASSAVRPATDAATPTGQVCRLGGPGKCGTPAQ